MPDLYTLEVVSVCERPLQAVLEELLLELAQAELPNLHADDAAPP